MSVTAEPLFPMTCPGPRLGVKRLFPGRGSAPLLGAWEAGRAGGRLPEEGLVRSSRPIRTAHQNEASFPRGMGGRGCTRRPAALPSSSGVPLPAGCPPSSRFVRPLHWKVPPTGSGTEEALPPCRLPAPRTVLFTSLVHVSIWVWCRASSAEAGSVGLGSVGLGLVVLEWFPHCRLLPWPVQCWLC